MDKAKLTSTLRQIKDLVEECLADIQDAAKPPRVAKKPSAPIRVSKPKRIDFDKPMRPFIKYYAKGMNGQKKFALLLSRLVKGELNKEIELKEIEGHWNKMKSKDLLGMDFNRFYVGEAKDNDWVDSQKKGYYYLRPNWKEIFESSNG